ncbi:hypothetical protein [Streptomyces aureus]
MEHPLPTRNRLANAALGVVPAVAGVACALDAGSWPPRLGAAAAVTGFAVLAVRGYRLGVTWDQRRLTVRGHLRTRVIHREQITEITDFPAVRWRTPEGRTRWTPLTDLVTASGEFAKTRHRKERSLKKLRGWLAG